MVLSIFFFFLSRFVNKVRVRVHVERVDGGVDILSRFVNRETRGRVHVERVENSVLFLFRRRYGLPVGWWVCRYSSRHN